MALSDIVNVNITKDTATQSRAGFGIPMIMSGEAQADSKFAATAKVYGSLDELGVNGDNYNLDGPTYLKAQAIFAQARKVEQIVIGKRANLPQKTVRLTPIAKNSTLYQVTIGGRGAGLVSQTFSFTSDATATVAEITAGLTAAINAGNQNVLATDNTTNVTVASAASPGGVAGAGKPFVLTVNSRGLFTYLDTTTDPGIAADLTSIRTNLDGNDDWYTAMVDSAGKLEITALATAIEAAPRKTYSAATRDDEVLAGTGGNIMATLQTAAHVRTFVMWHETPHLIDGAWPGRALPFDPGSLTWRHLTLATIAASKLTTAERTTVEGLNGNYYVTEGGRNVTFFGWTSGGEFIDVTRGIDWLQARLEEDIFFVLSDNLKIPFTDAGIGTIVGTVRSRLFDAVGNGLLAPDSEGSPIFVTAPRAAAVLQADKANRTLPDVDFQATLAGAIHEVTINGTITV